MTPIWGNLEVGGAVYRWSGHEARFIVAEAARQPPTSFDLLGGNVRWGSEAKIVSSPTPHFGQDEHHLVRMLLPPALRHVHRRSHACLILIDATAQPQAVTDLIEPFTRLPYPQMWALHSDSPVFPNARV
jgi:hypothetical protein